MPNDYFAFKQFCVWQDKSAMKVGTDGVMLGAWTHVPVTGRILDAGTGTGLIALMLAQRSGGIVDAVEIDADSAMQAGVNVNSSPWNDRINVIHGAFQDFASGTENKYDLVVSNPPFFDNVLKPPDERRSAARHTVTLTFRDLAHYSQMIMAPYGILSVILPAEVSDVFITEAFMEGLHPKRILVVRPMPSKPPSRKLTEFSRERNYKPDISEIVIKEKGDFTEAFKNLTRDYYLNF